MVACGLRGGGLLRASRRRSRRGCHGALRASRRVPVAARCGLRAAPRASRRRPRRPLVRALCRVSAALFVRAYSSERARGRCLSAGAKSRFVSEQCRRACAARIVRDARDRCAASDRPPPACSAPHALNVYVSYPPCFGKLSSACGVGAQGLVRRRVAALPPSCQRCRRVVAAIDHPPTNTTRPSVSPRT